MSQRRPGKAITVGQLQNEWASLVSKATDEIVVGRGKTVEELAAEIGVAPQTMVYRLKKLIAAGKVKRIGVRPSRGRAVVYEIVGKGKP